MRIVITISILLLTACQPSTQIIRLHGQTMGTTYSIVAVAHKGTNKTDLQKEIEQKLKHVNNHLSNWQKTSEISQLNANESTQRIKISPMLATVMTTANEVHEKSRGAFDVTLGPVISLWGFGPRTPQTVIPAKEKIETAMSTVGQKRKLSLDDHALWLKKHNPQTKINLSAIAKGYGADEIGAVLHQHKIEDFMVEIGGDLLTSGKNPKGNKWRVGIEKPVSTSRSVQLAVSSSNAGMATSGDYRNYVEKDGVRYSHIIDPATGRPVTHKTASVTVIAKSAMLADGWATALLVLGAKEGMKIAEKHDLAVFFIVKTSNADAQEFTTAMSRNFAAILKSQ